MERCSEALQLCSYKVDWVGFGRYLAMMSSGVVLPSTAEKAVDTHLGHLPAEADKIEPSATRLLHTYATQPAQSWYALPLMHLHYCSHPIALSSLHVFSELQKMVCKKRRSAANRLTTRSVIHRIEYSRCSLKPEAAGPGGFIPCPVWRATCVSLAEDCVGEYVHFPCA
jgi:hypothetical protein